MTHRTDEAEDLEHTSHEDIIEVFHRPFPMHKNFVR